MAQKPYIQEVFKSLDNTTVKDKSEKLVSDLVKKGYLVRVLIENYVSVYDDKSTRMVYQTTVIATSHDNVDIGMNK